MGATTLNKNKLLIFASTKQYILYLTVTYVINFEKTTQLNNNKIQQQ